MKTQYVIVVVDISKIGDSAGCRELNALLCNVQEKIRSIQEIEMLSKNTFLIPLHDQSSDLLQTLRDISLLGLSYKMTVLENKPTFISSPM